MCLFSRHLKQQWLNDIPVDHRREIKPKKPLKKDRTLTFASMKKQKGLYPNFTLQHNDENFSIYKHVEKNLAMVVFHPFQMIDLYTAKKIEQHVFQVVDKQKPIFGITLPTEGSSVDRDGRTYFANCELSQNYTQAMAVIVSGLPHRMLFNFYTQFNRPPAKHRAFNKLSTALEWLERQGC